METMTEIIVSINPVMLTQLATVSKLTVKNNAPMQLNILNLTCQHVISSAINQLLVQQINQLGMQIRALANAIKEMLQVNSLLGMHLLAHTHVSLHPPYIIAHSGCGTKMRRKTESGVFILNVTVKIWLDQ